MFYDKFIELCEQNNIKPSKAATEIGFNKSSVTNWKNNGYTPKNEILVMIANYFNVSVDYLLGKTEQKNKAPTEQMDSDDALLFGLYGRGDVSDITPDMIAEIREIAQIKREMKKRKNGIK